MGRDKLSFKPTIASPCEESWTAMQGGSRERHCQLCDKQVHNFAAMSSREIERVVREADGKLCARITRRRDGSLVTLDGLPRAPVVAQIVASASLAMGAAGVLAQADGQPSQAVLTGTVIKSDQSGPASKAEVMLISRDDVIARAETNESGQFRISAPAGLYDIAIRQSPLSGARILAVSLHDGLQILQPTRANMGIMVSAQSGDIVTLGEMSGTFTTRYSFRAAVTHPWSYLKYLARKI